MTETRVEPELVEAIARRVVELLRSESSQEDSVRLVDAATLARELGVERDWVYAHAKRLGGIRLGGPQGRLRFDRELVREQLAEDGSPQRQPRKRAPLRGGKRSRSKRPPQHAEVRSPQKQRRASGDAPAQRLSDNTGR